MKTIKKEKVIKKIKNPDKPSEEIEIEEEVEVEVEVEEGEESEEVEMEVEEEIEIEIEGTPDIIDGVHVPVRYFTIKFNNC